MSQDNKYAYRAVQKETTWTAEITRRASSKKTVVSKYQDGFKTETEAKEWGQTELKDFLQYLISRNTRRSKKA